MKTLNACNWEFNEKKRRWTKKKHKGEREYFILIYFDIYNCLGLVVLSLHIGKTVCLGVVGLPL